MEAILIPCLVQGLISRVHFNLLQIFLCACSCHALQTVQGGRRKNKLKHITVTVNYLMLAALQVV